MAASQKEIGRKINHTVSRKRGGFDVSFDSRNDGSFWGNAPKRRKKRGNYLQISKGFAKAGGFFKWQGPDAGNVRGI